MGNMSSTSPARTAWPISPAIPSAATTRRATTSIRSRSRRPTAGCRGTRRMGTRSTLLPGARRLPGPGNPVPQRSQGGSDAEAWPRFGRRRSRRPRRGDLSVSDSPGPGLLLRVRWPESPRRGEVRPDGRRGPPRDVRLPGGRTVRSSCSSRGPTRSRSTVGPRASLRGSSTSFEFPPSTSAIIPRHCSTAPHPRSDSDSMLLRLPLNRPRLRPCPRPRLRPGPPRPVAPIQGVPSTRSLPESSGIVVSTVTFGPASVLESLGEGGGIVVTSAGGEIRPAGDRGSSSPASLFFPGELLVLGSGAYGGVGVGEGATSPAAETVQLVLQDPSPAVSPGVLHLVTLVQPGLSIRSGSRPRRTRRGGGVFAPRDPGPGR